MHNFVSLMLFTLTAQAAIGMILVNSVMIAAGRVSREDSIIVESRHLVTLLLIIALATAFFHLGKPFRAVYALSNIFRSPLSMEIASLSLLLVISLVDSWLSFSSGNSAIKSFLPFVSVVAALLLLITMTAIYLISSVPAWHNFRTPISFALTAVSAGPAVLAIVMSVHEVTMARRLLLIASFSTLLLLFIIMPHNIGGPSLHSGLVLLQAAALAIALIFTFLSLSVRKMNKNYHFTVISGTLVLISLLIARFLFFLSYDNNIL